MFWGNIHILLCLAVLGAIIDKPLRFVYIQTYMLMFTLEVNKEEYFSMSTGELFNVLM